MFSRSVQGGSTGPRTRRPGQNDTDIRSHGSARDRARPAFEIEEHTPIGYASADMRIHRHRIEHSVEIAATAARVWREVTQVSFAAPLEQASAGR